MIPKFRVWHKPMQIMGEVLAISFERQKVKIRHLRGTTNMTVPFDDVELMQSTGLFDSAGVEMLGQITDKEIIEGRYTVTAEAYGKFLVTKEQYKAIKVGDPIPEYLKERGD